MKQEKSVKTSKAKIGDPQANTAPITISGRLMIGERVRMPTGRIAVYKGGENVGQQNEHHEFTLVEGSGLALSRRNLILAIRE
jgi:hypothetical protein